MSTRSGLVRISTTSSSSSPTKTRKGASPSRSPARTKRRSPPSVTSSNKSPSRKSPSRKSASKFPARKSPSRATKESTETPAPKSPVKRAVVRDVEIKLQHNTAITEIIKGVRSRRSDYSIKDLSSNKTDNNKYAAKKVNGFDAASSSNDYIPVYSIRMRQPVEEAVPRSSSRLRDIIDNVTDTRRSLSSRSVALSHSKSRSKSLGAVSDEDTSGEDLEKEHTKSVTRKLATPLRDDLTKLAQMSRWEFGGRIGSFLLIFLMPLTVFLIIISCKTTCSIKSSLDLTALKYVSTWFSPQALALISGQFLIQAVFALLPLLGTTANRMDGSGTKYCFNAFFSSIFTILILFCLDFTGILKSQTLLNDYLKLATTSYIFAVILSIIVYVKSWKIPASDLNTYAKTGFVSYDFWMGREIHTYFKKLNIKIWTSRISNISTLILAVLIFKQGFTIPKDIENVSLQDYKQISSKIKINPALILYSMMQIIYILNFIMREYKITSTFYWQSEGVGYLQIVSSALYPYYFTTMSKFVAEYKLPLETNILIISLVFFMLGFFLMLLSNNIKYEFRNNPLQPAFSRIETMPTFHGKKLLISGIWGILRHPNYAGDILVHIALALPGIWSGRLVAALPAVLTILMLLHRAWRDHARCSRRYGAAWQRYCKRTPSVIIPKVL